MSYHFESRFSLKESRNTLTEKCVVINQQQTDAFLGRSYSSVGSCRVSTLVKLTAKQHPSRTRFEC